VMLLEAAQILSPGSPVCCLRDFVIHNPVKMKTERISLRVRAALENDGLHCGVSREFYNRGGKLIDPCQTIASAIAQRDAGEIVPLPPIREVGPEWVPVAYRDLQQAETEDHVYFGPGMRCLKELAITPLDPAGRIVAPDADGDTRLGLHPALLDACFVACGIYCLRKLQSPVLVHGVAHLRVGRPAEPGEECLLRYVWRGAEDPFQVFDFSLTGANGDPLLDARRCTLIQRGGLQ
jgi:hypothetical protein